MTQTTVTPVSSGGESSLTAEERFYLPWNDSGLTKEFGAKESSDQKQYAKLCARAHDVLANRCLEWAENPEAASKGISLTERLYREAAKMRRAIEWRPRDSQPYARYGTPLVSNPNAAVMEEVTPDSERYAVFYEQARRSVGDIIEQFTLANHNSTADALSKELFGPNYRVEVMHFPDNQHRVRVYEFNEDHRQQTLVAQIAYSPDQDHIALMHGFYSNRKAIFAMADVPLKRLIHAIREHQHKDWDSTSRQQFWHDLADFSLHLYHAAPLNFGSQTATLTILAGLCKASGLTPAPGDLHTDHFMDAEIIPYCEYTNDYQHMFGNKFTDSGRSITHPIHVNTSFIDQGISAQIEHFKALGKTPQERAQAYLDTVLWKPTQYDQQPNGPRVVHECLQDNEGRTHVRVEPDFQTTVDDAIDFIGHDEMARLLGVDKKRGRRESVRLN